MPFGNVNVDYKPCKSVGQLKSSALYMLGKKPEQLRDGVIKTVDNLYSSLGCNRDNFANNVLVTRKLNGKSYSRLKPNTILAHKMSISFHPKDSEKLTYTQAYEIAKDFAEKFIHAKGYEVLFAVHTDREHIHAHFLIGNCNIETGKSYRRSQHDLYEMSRYLGFKCVEYRLNNSVRDDFYNHDLSRTKETFAEIQMKKRGAESFKEELREAIQVEIADFKNRSFDDVIVALQEHYSIECRVAGNTVSYRHPEHKDKNGKLVSVRAGKLGDLYTRKGIENELRKKSRTTADFDFDRATTGLGAFVGEDTATSGERPSISGGQASSVAPPRHDGKALQDFDKLYDRYRKRADEDEHGATETAEHSGAVQERNKKVGR